MLPVLFDLFGMFEIDVVCFRPVPDHSVVLQEIFYTYLEDDFDQIVYLHTNILKSHFKSLVHRTLSIIVRHMTGTGSGLLGEIPRVVVQKSALL